MPGEDDGLILEKEFELIEVIFQVGSNYLRVSEHGRNVLVKSANHDAVRDRVQKRTYREGDNDRGDVASRVVE